MFKARDIMNTDIVTVHPDDTVERALTLMLQYRITGLIVAGTDGELLGVVSDYDLLDVVYACDVERDEVRHYMSTDVQQVNEETSWCEVADILRAHRIRRLPVTREGKVVGIITRHDMIRTVHDLRYRTRQLFQQTLSEGGVGEEGLCRR